MRDKPVFFGWKVAWAAFVVAIFGWGIGFYGPPVFLHAVIERTGWPLTLVSSAVTLHLLVGVLVVANSAALYRRFGVARVTITGAAILILGVIGWATAQAPYQLFGAALLTGCGWVTMGAVAMNAIVAPWFERKRPAALSLAYNGSSLGGVILSPLWVLLIQGWGFLAASLIVGAVTIGAVAWIGGHYLAPTPATMGLAPDGEVSTQPQQPGHSPSPTPLPRLLTNWSFLSLAAAMACGLFAQIGLIAHLFAVLVTPFGAGTAGLLMGAATLSALIGRTLTGFLMPPHLNRRVVASLSYCIQMLGAGLLILSEGSNTPLMVAGVLLFGWGIGNATSTPPLIAQQEFAKEEVQRIVSLIVAGAQTAYAFAPAAFAAAHALTADWFGPSPTAFFAMTATFQGLAIACMLCGRRWTRHKNKPIPVTG